MCSWCGEVCPTEKDATGAKIVKSFMDARYPEIYEGEYCSIDCYLITNSCRENVQKYNKGTEKCRMVWTVRDSRTVQQILPYTTQYHDPSLPLNPYLKYPRAQTGYEQYFEDDQLKFINYKFPVDQMVRFNNEFKCNAMQC